MIGNPMQTVGERALAGLGIAVLTALVVVTLLVWSADRRHLDGRPRIWRWLNLVTMGLVAVLAIDLVPDLAEETEWAHRADEVVVQLLAALAVAWYVSGRRRLGRSLMPLTIAAAVELVKLAAIPVEWSDTADVQGDIVLATIGAPVVAALALLYLRPWRRSGPAAPDTAD